MSSSLRLGFLCGLGCYTIWGCLPLYGQAGAQSEVASAYQHFIVDEAKMARTDNAFFSHCLPVRRNVNVNILLFNNRVYGLTKGEYSPTSPVGTRTKTTPMGSIDNPLNPILFALGAEATFIARTVDTNPRVIFSFEWNHKTDRDLLILVVLCHSFQTIVVNLRHALDWKESDSGVRH